MGQPEIKVIGEGGAHSHKLESPEKTQKDGLHKHLFFVNDRLIMTELDGDHWHPVNPKSNEVGPEAEPRHLHKILIRTEGGILEFQTSDGSPHPHELQTENTTLSGLHTHTVNINGEKFLSLLPGDLIDEVEGTSKRNKQFKNFSLKKHLNGPLELDFGLIQKLNKPEFLEILKRSVVNTLFKGLSRLSDGMRIQSLILSKDRFTDIGSARRFVMDHNLDVRSSEDKDGIFSFQVLSNDRFEESTLQRIRITEGVEAVVGFLTEQSMNQPGEEASIEAKPEESLPENAVESNRHAESESTTLDAAQDNLKTSLSGLKKKLNLVQGFYEANQEIKKRHKVEFSIIEKNEEERLVKAPALIPEQTDLQNEVVSANEIRRAAHNYMIKMNFQKDPDFLKSIGLNTRADRGFMHVEFTRKMAIVESSIAVEDRTENGRNIRKGTWIVTMKIFDDEVWNLIKAGKITGFSIGGRANLIEDKSKTVKFEPDFEKVEWRAA